MIAGDRRVAGREEVFNLRLGSDLSPREGGTVAFPSPVPTKAVGMPAPPPGPTPAGPQTVCPPPHQAGKALQEITPFNATLTSAVESLYASGEGCVVRITSAGGTPYGFVTRSVLDPATATVTIKVHVQLPDPGDRVAVSLEDADGGERIFVTIREFVADADGVVNVAFDFPEPLLGDPDLARFISEAGEIHMAITDPSLSFQSDDDDEMECDMVQIDG